MDPDYLAGMIFTLLLVALVGGFILLFPVSRRLGQLLEAKLTSAAAMESEEAKRLWEAVQALDTELRSLSERQEFTDRLLAERSKTRRPAEERGVVPPGQ